MYVSGYETRVVMVVWGLSATIRRMKNNALALLGLPVLGLLVLALPACNSTGQESGQETGQEMAAVDDPVPATLPEIRYYEIADT